MTSKTCCLFLCRIFFLHSVVLVRFGPFSSLRVACTLDWLGVFSPCIFRYQVRQELPLAASPRPRFAKDINLYHLMLSLGVLAFPLLLCTAI